MKKIFLFISFFICFPAYGGQEGDTSCEEGQTLVCVNGEGKILLGGKGVCPPGKEGVKLACKPAEEVKAAEKAAAAKNKKKKKAAAKPDKAAKTSEKGGEISPVSTPTREREITISLTPEVKKEVKEGVEKALKNLELSLPPSPPKGEKGWCKSHPGWCATLTAIATVIGGAAATAGICGVAGCFGDIAVSQ